MRKTLAVVVVVLMPTGYTISGDPWMSSNPYAAGVRPKTMYTAGSTYNKSGGFLTAPTSIRLWSSDFGGEAWSNGGSQVQVDNTSGYLLDKPEVSVSHHTNTLGHTYVVYLRVNQADEAQNSIRVRRSRTGGARSFSLPTWDPEVLIAEGLVTGPQVAVNSLTGAVYVLWVDYTAKKIKMRTSTDGAQTFGAAEDVASFVPAGSNGCCVINGGIRAITLPHLRYNSAADRLSVIWHAAESSTTTTKTDLFYTSRTPTGAWSAPVQYSRGNDQFMPAIDYAGSGNLLATFYDRQHDPNNKLYREAYLYISPTGSVLTPVGTLTGSDSDPTSYFIGDYQMVFYWTFADGARWNASWTKKPSGGSGDIFLSGIK